MDAPAKTPIEALYLELGATPIKFLLMMRRLMYLNHMPHDDEGGRGLDAVQSAAVTDRQPWQG